MQRGNHINLRNLFMLNALAGAGVLVLLLQSKSTEKNAFLLGYSLWNLATILASTVLWLGFIALSIAAARRSHGIDRLAGWLIKFPALSQSILSTTITIALCTAGLAVIFLTGNWDRLGGPGKIIERGAPLILWLVTIYIEYFLYYLSHKKTMPAWNPEGLLSFTLVIAVVIFIVLDTLFRTDGFGLERLYEFLQTQILPDWLWILGLGTAYFLLAKSARNQSTSRGATSVLIRKGLIALVAIWIVYSLSIVAVKKHPRSTPEQAYSPDLAAALLQGKTYLDNPSGTVDLTYYEGHWYVPQPPLVALLILPQVALFGPASVHMINLSIMLASLSGALVFMILSKLRELDWINPNGPTIIWLTALFSLGTVHWYLALWGPVWAVNQISTITFVATAVLLTLLGSPAWLVGSSLGLAMLARPHIALVWPFLLGLFWESHKGQERSTARRSRIKWAAWSVIPPVLAAIGLLWYNQIRFGSPVDFGYRTASVGLFHNELQTYGQFNAHFILRNLQVILFSLPAWNPTCGFLSPSEIGMSVFITTPALLYLYRARRNTPWVTGAWITIALLVTVLLFHYSTGALQFGYRYLMDFIIPVMALLGLSSPRGEIPLSMKVLILAGILVNYWGLWWLFTHWCR